MTINEHMLRFEVDETIQVLCRLFATHVVPDIIVFNNGSCFTSREFKEFATAIGMKHITTEFLSSQFQWNS